jgi:TFIIF-interacting CTD phosphatase-like protein
MKQTSEKPFNLILDLDETIIHSLSPEEEETLNKNQLREYKNIKDKFKHSMGDDDYMVIERPNLQEFLDFIFKHFNISVWTAASKEYALFIIDEIIIANKPERSLDLILFSTHCGYAKKKYGGMKNLKMVEEVCGYDLTKTIILDDHPDVHLTQIDNCIRMKPFELSLEKREVDNFLMNNVKPALEKIIKNPSDDMNIQQINKGIMNIQT